MAAFTGARLGELHGLRWPNVDLTEGQESIVIAEQVYRGETKERAKPPSGYRKIILGPEGGRSAPLAADRRAVERPRPRLPVTERHRLAGEQLQPPPLAENPQGSRIARASFPRPPTFLRHLRPHDPGPGSGAYGAARRPQRRADAPPLHARDPRGGDDHPRRDGESARGSERDVSAVIPLLLPPLLGGFEQSRNPVR